MRFLLLILLLVASALPTQAEPIETFAEFIQSFAPKARAAGVTDATYAAAMGGLTEDPKIPGLITGQPEFSTPIWDYMDGRITRDRIARGQAAIERNRALFTAAGQRFGVDPYVLGAIWGIETDFGAVLDNDGLIKPIVRSLATLVHQRRGRLEADEAELIAALLLVQRGPFTAKTLVGSWAGAIGHLQVTPTVVLGYGTDGDEDNMVNIHASLADALATSAMFLRSMGYLPGVDWGFEVELPSGFDYTLASRDLMRPVREFARLGVTRVKGRPFANLDQDVFLYVPAGQNGPKFLMTPNYLVLKGYNFSDSYALTVAHLADRLKGGGSFVVAWPRDTAFPNLEQRVAIQQALTRLGLYSGVVDGRLGPVSQAAYAQFQASRGLVADGFITLRSYEELAAAAR